MEEAAALKRNCYQTTRREVERNNPGVEMRLMTFIISILGVLQQPEDSWESQLKGMGMTTNQSQALEEASMLECVMAGHKLNNTFRSRMEAIRAVKGGVVGRWERVS
eukprot:2819283-Rhodomonas_salina.2